MINPAFSLSQREIWLMSYIAALDSGDESALEFLLKRIKEEAELARLLDEIHGAFAQEFESATDLAAQVRELGRRHLSQDVAAVSETVRVDEVAGYLLQLGPDAAEKERLEPFLNAQIPVPLLLTRANLEALARELAAAVDEKFLRRFKDAAITVRMSRTTPRSQLALARQEKKEKPADVE